MRSEPLLEFHSLALMVTKRCPFACAHCYTHSSPSRTERLGLEQGVKTIEALWPLVSFIALSGGEPLLEVDRVVAYAEAVRGRRPVNVVSSGFFSSQGKKALPMLRRIKAAGVSLLNLSFDLWHEEYSALESVLRAGALGQEAGLSVIVQLVGKPSDALIYRARTELDAAGLGHFLVSLSSMGRAASLDADTFEGEIPDAGCSLIRSLSLDEAGVLRACCGPTFGCGEETAFHLAQVAQLDAEQLRGRVEEAMRDPLLAGVSSLGPRQLMALDGDPELTGARSICDYCLKALGDPERAARLRVILSRRDNMRRLIGGQLLARETLQRQVDEGWQRIAEETGSDV